jgi:hypothetical protein
MASGGKKKTTMAKLTRESKLRERRADKQARKDARKHVAANPHLYPTSGDQDPESTIDAEPTDVETADADTASI